MCHEKISLDSVDIPTMKNLGCLACSGGNSVQGISVDVFTYIKGFPIEDYLFCFCTVKNQDILKETIGRQLSGMVQKQIGCLHIWKT